MMSEKTKLFTAALFTAASFTTASFTTALLPWFNGRAGKLDTLAEARWKT
jgi:hypothetical protein